MTGRRRDALLLVDARHRRRVARLVRRLERLERKELRGPGSGPRDHTLRSSGRRRSTTAVAFLVLMVGGLYVASVVNGGPGGVSGFPDRPADAADAPLGAPAGARADSDAYAFIQTQDDGDDPVTYDPCVPIHVVVDARTIVDGGMKLLDEALDEVSEASGLRFVVDGLTERAAPEDGTVTGPDGGWLPVTVSWSDPKASPQLKGDVAGYAGSASVERDGHRWFVTGSVVLDGPQLDSILESRRGRASARSVIMHEVGHLIGLDHVDAPGQLMQPTGDETITGWGNGDLTGLEAVGRGRCIDY